MMHRRAAALAVVASITAILLSCASAPRSTTVDEPASSSPTQTPLVTQTPPELSEAEKEQMALSAVYKAVERGDYPAAEAGLSSLVARYPDNASYPVLRAAVLVSMQRLDDARAVLNAELAARPGNTEALYALAELERFAGDAKAHRQAIEALLVMDPGNPAARVAMGDIHYDSKNYSKAQASYEAALASSPDDVDALLGLARVMYRRDDMQGALAALNGAVAAAPDNPLAYLDRSRVNYQLGRYADCEADLEAAIRLAPESAWSYVERGRLYLDTGRFDEAMADFSASIRLNPDYFLPYVYRAAIYEETGDDAAALTDYRMASKLYPEYWYTLESIGVLAYRMGLWKEAYESFDRATTYTTGHGEYYVAAALSLMRSGDLKAARTYAEKKLPRIDRAKDPLHWLALRLAYDQSDMTSELEISIGAEKSLDLKAGSLFYLGAYWVARGRTEMGAKYIRMSYDDGRVGTIEYRMAEADLARLEATE
ncbi:MAG: tetratricopeptide repeat protein [Spirochaetales bacterium]|nr:tetratricopeptide repeat protein [Spirochaetales bacterium]